MSHHPTTPHRRSRGARPSNAVSALESWFVGGLDRSTIVVASVTTLGLIMVTLDTTIVNVALDTLSRQLHARLSSIQWVSTGYLLSLALVIPVSGWLTERFGSKRTWIASIALFTVGSGLCAMSSSAGELIAFRILQGLGGGMVMPLGFTLIAQSAGPQHVGRALGLIGVPVLLGPILGPIAGGLIVDNAPWQWIFVVNLPIGVAAIALAARVLAPRAGRADAGSFDWRGALFLCPGLAAVVFGLSETQARGGISHPITIGPVIAGLLLIGLFAWHSLRVERPLLDLRLLRSPAFRAVAGTTFLLGAALFGTLLVLPLYYQVDRGESALSAGLLLAPQGLGAAMMLPISGRLTDRVGGGPTVLAGCLLLAAATVPFVFVTGHTPYALLAAVLLIRGVGLGASVQPSVAAAYRMLGPSEVPRATATLNALRQVGGSIGTTILAVVLQQQAAAKLGSVGHGSGGLLSPLPPAERVRISGPVAMAFGHTFMWAAAIALLTLLPAAALLRAERASRRQPPERRRRTGELAVATRARRRSATSGGAT